MSDDLVKRLRGWAKDIQEGSTAIWAMDQDLKEAAARIEELEAKRAKLAEALRGWIEVANAEGMPVPLSKERQMSEAPERIWVEGAVYDRTWEHSPASCLFPYEYVQADLVAKLEAKLTRAVAALDEAVYMLAPNDEDMAKKAGVYRIVTTFKELKGETDE